MIKDIKHCKKCVHRHRNKHHNCKIKKCCKCLKKHICHIVKEYAEIVQNNYDQNQNMPNNNITTPSILSNVVNNSSILNRNTLICKPFTKKLNISSDLLQKILESKNIANIQIPNQNNIDGLLEDMDGIPLLPSNLDIRNKLLLQNTNIVKPNTTTVSNLATSVKKMNIVTSSQTYPIYTPMDLVNAYDMNTFDNNNVQRGLGQTITIVIAYHYPNLLTDLNTFKSNFLPSSYPSPTVQVTEMYNVYLNGTDATKKRWAQNTNYNSYRNTSYTSGWYLEECMDLQAVYTMAPYATIRIICALGDSLTYINDAVQYAINFKDGNNKNTDIITMSFGINETSITSSNITSWSSFYKSNTLSLSLIASVGDTSDTIAFPSNLSNILSVGGTALFMNENSKIGNKTITQGNYVKTIDNNNTYLTEFAWNGSSGGISKFISMPSYQTNAGISLFNTSITKRTTPDVAAVADPYTGALIYAANTLQILGGTSLSAPLWAGILAVINQQRINLGKSQLHTNTPNGSTLHNALYDTTNTFIDQGSAISTSTFDLFRDIQYGYSGINVSDGGYDLITGLGSPCVALYKRLINTLP